MAPAGTKRAADASAEVAPAKRLNDLIKARGVSKKNYTNVMEALDHELAGLTPECREMLVAMVPSSLLIYSDQRQPAQSQAVKMLQDVFETIQEKMEAELKDSDARLADVKVNHDAIQAKVQGAEGVLAAALDEVSKHKGILADVTRRVLEAKAELSKKEKDRAQGKADLRKVQEEKAAIDAALENFTKLRDGEYEPGQADSHFEAITGVITSLLVDESLFTAMPASLKKIPQERGSFDAMVVAQIQEVFAKLAYTVTASIEAAGPAAAQREAAVHAAEHGLAAARDMQLRLSLNLRAALAAAEEAQVALDKTKEELASFMPTLSAAQAIQDEKSVSLEVFRSHNLGSFQRLRDRVATKEVVVEASEEAAVEAGA